jgi:hypothetical protein
MVEDLLTLLGAITGRYATAAILTRLASLVLLVGIAFAVRAARRVATRRGRRRQQPAGGRLTAGDANLDMPSADQVFLDAAKRLLDSQISSSDVLDTRIAGAFSVGSTILPVTIGLVNLLVDADQRLPDRTRVLLALAILAYVLVIGSSITSYLIRKIR